MIRIQPTASPRLVVFALLAIGALCSTAPRTEAQAPKRPNILWITTEDMSPRIGPYGDAVARTPHLDRLARESVRFTRAFTTSPVCAPSRAAIITGMYQNAIGAQHMRTGIDLIPEMPGPYQAVPPFYVKAFPEYLRAAGYYTTNNSKTDYQFGEPFTVWDESSPQAHWRNRPDRERPFFAVFNHMTTHETQLLPNTPAHRGKALVTDPAKVEVPPYYPDTPAVREELARHYDNIAEMDRLTGEILRQLEEDGLADSTIVFFWSDHGDGLPRAKRSLYDAGLHVPLMVRWPRSLNPEFQPGTVNDQLVSFVDLAPTVLALAGAAVPNHLHGRVLLGPKTGPLPEYIFGARDRMDIEYDMMRSVRNERFLYVRNFHPELPYAGFIPFRNQSAIMQELLRLQAEGKLTGAPALWMQNHRPAEELYDVQADPHKLRNLADEPAHQATLVRMRMALDDWMVQINDQGLMTEAEMIQRMWPGGVQPATAQPYIVARRSSNWNRVTRESAQDVGAPMEVEVYVPTQGASIGYTTEEGPDAKWKLYTGPIRVDGPVTIRAKAIRYGYKESEEARATFTRATAAAPE